MILRSLLLLSLTLLTACSGGRDKGSYVLAPNIDFECSDIQSSQCNASAVGKTLFMGLTTDVDFDCESELYQLSPSLLTPTFDYSGYATVQDGGTYVWGVVTQWVNAAGGKVIEIENTDYQVCAFIDDNSNGRFDGIESLAEQSFNPTVSFYPVSDWFQP